MRDPTDTYLVEEYRGDLVAVLIDGHGQGQMALSASLKALAVVKGALNHDPPQFFARTHQRLTDSTGVSMVQARVSPEQERVDFHGVGRIHGLVLSARGVVSLESAPGVLGMGRVVPPHSQVVKWTRDSLLLLASDGVVDRWKLDLVDGLFRASPALVIHNLIQPFGRIPDDVTLIAIRES